MGIIDANMKAPASQHGFTLVELLMTILIIGILAVSATAHLSGMSDAAAGTRDQQNAQMLASVAMSAQAAGLDFVDPDGDLGRTVAAISVGGTVRTGAFAGQFFGLRLGTAEGERAMAHLRIDGGSLVYLGR